jgi:pyridoxal phosphate enzyme (YggS family)
MQYDRTSLERILSELENFKATLVAVSKKKPASAVQEVYDAGHSVFGENYVQELVDKAAQLPEDIEWHFIGHLQTNKVKQIAPFISLIHGVDSLGLLKEIDRQAKKNNRIIDCLLQVFIAKEETKFGLSFEEADQLLGHPDFHALKNICVRGLMGMASNTEDRTAVKKEFHSLSEYFHILRSKVFTAKKPNGKQPHLLSPLSEIKVQPETKPYPVESNHSNLRPEILSMGMSGDYKIALGEGSTMVRIGSLIFGER